MCFQSHCLIVEMKSQKIIESSVSKHPINYSEFLKDALSSDVYSFKARRTEGEHKRGLQVILFLMVKCYYKPCCCYPHCLLSLGFNGDGNLIITRSPPR